MVCCDSRVAIAVSLAEPTACKFSGFHAFVWGWVELQRDFPEATEKNHHLGFVSDNIKSNLQQMVMSELEKHGQGCYDVRSREIKNQYPSDIDQRARLFIRTYRCAFDVECLPQLHTCHAICAFAHKHDESVTHDVHLKEDALLASWNMHFCQ